MPNLEARYGNCKFWQLAFWAEKPRGQGLVGTAKYFYT
jgi:hypothetical protein